MVGKRRRYPLHWASDVFDLMQRNRHYLLRDAEEAGLDTKNGQALLRLVKMLEDGKNAMKDTFEQAIAEYELPKS
jgi:hypothetical protein